jgi:integron integrase
MAAPEITRFLTWLAVEGNVASSTQNQALSALLFLYREVLRQDVAWIDGIVRARRPERLPVVLTRDEVRALLSRLAGPTRLMAYLMYGGGLRLLESCRLRVQDVDFGANQIVVRAGKGDKDRMTMLPAAVKADLAQHLEAMQAQHQRDLRHGAGWVELPSALERKYPNAGRDWRWQWVFPATRTYVEPLTRQCRRHHLHESVVQRAVKEAVLRAGLAKTGGAAHAPPFLRDASIGERARHPHRPGAARSPRRVDHHDLHPCAQPGPGRRPEPRRPPRLGRPAYLDTPAVITMANDRFDGSFAGDDLPRAELLD